MNAHTSGYIRLENDVGITNVKTNSSNSLTYTAAGQVNTEGKCTGSVYHWPGVTYTGVTVVKSITVTLKDFDSYVSLKEDNVHIGEGISCDYSKGSCMDVNHRLTYRRHNEKEECESRHYSVLYHGKAEKAYITSSYAGMDKVETIYTVDQDEMIFALVVKSVTTMCISTINKCYS